MYTSAGVCVRVCAFVRVCAYVCVRVFVRVYVCSGVSIYVFVCIYIRVCCGRYKLIIVNIVENVFAVHCTM